MVTVERVGRRSYLKGNTFPIKDALRSAGAKWDGDAKAWWVGDHAKAEELASKHAGKAAAVSETKREAPGEDAVVAGRAQYKGKSYFIAGRVDRGRTHYDDRVSAMTSRDGSRVMLYFRDGSSSFWAARADVSVGKSYDRPQTIGRLQRFAEKAKEARAQGNEDGIADGQRYECEECGEYVTRGQGSCWETGASH